MLAQLLIGAAVSGQFPGMGGMGGPPEVEPGTNHVKMINQQIFDEIVKPDEMWMMKFYAPWCASPRHAHAAQFRPPI
jgi:hypothetical protein